MSKDILLLSNDAIFARMLFLELEENGFNPIRGNVYKNASFIVADIDSLSEEEKEILSGRTIPTLTFSYNAGIADFMRPFSVAEFIDKIKLHFTEDYKEITKKEEKSELIINENKKTVTYGGELIEFTQREFTLFLYLFKNRGKVVTSEELINKVWDNREDNNNVLRVYINYLREKLDNRFGVKLIVTVRDKGYMLKNNI